MKTNQQVKPVIDLAARTVMFEVRGKPSLVLHLDRLHADIIARAALVGMAQTRIVDAAAIGTTDAEGRVIPQAERIEIKYERMRALIEHYETGTDQWTRGGQGAGGGAGSITIAAIARVRGIMLEEATAAVEAYVDREAACATPRFVDVKGALAFLRRGKAVREAIEALRRERDASLPAALDADEALAELGSAPTQSCTKENENE